MDTEPKISDARARLLQYVVKNLNPDMEAFTTLAIFDFADAIREVAFAIQDTPRQNHYWHTK